ncbi:hypothetical protein FQA39_LY01685 [Lamprigera yunnana]|nr:hypothetical protein FQA39_LY01685 [Lamprigera yunnana]
MEHSTIQPPTPTPSDLFSWFDYGIFSVMLLVSIIIGVYFGFFGKKQQSAVEYLRGGKQMKVLPVAVSLIASQISTTTLLAVPADVYKFGGNYMWLFFPTIIECFITYHVFLPVYYKLQLTSIFEYVELRFDKKLRFLISFFAIIIGCLFAPIVIYIPSLAFSQVTGVNVHLIACITSAICIFYTTIGGLKAVVWTDTLQFGAMVVTFTTLLFMGVSDVRGFSFVWNKSVEGQRLNIFDFDPTLRDSFGAIMIGGTVQWLGYTAINPGVIQKFLSVPKYSDVKKVVSIFGIGVSLIHIFAGFTGLVLYAKYWNCDPMSTKEVVKLEQLVPYFAMEIMGSYPGLPGIFIAGIYSAGLSSLSAYLNTLSALIYEDFIKPFVPKETSQKTVSNILKLIVLVSGIVSTLLVLVIEKLQGMFLVHTALIAVTLGPMLGIFTLGLLIPMANSKGTFVGAVSASVIIAWITIQNQKYQNENLYHEFIKPISTEGCNFTVTSNTTMTTHSVDVDHTFILYQISVWFYCLIGCTITVIVGVIISYFTTHDKLPVPLDLLSPVIHPFFREKVVNTEQVEFSGTKEVELQLLKR